MTIDPKSLPAVKLAEDIARNIKPALDLKEMLDSPALKMARETGESVPLNDLVPRIPDYGV